MHKAFHHTNVIKKFLLMNIVSTLCIEPCWKYRPARTFRYLQNIWLRALMLRWTCCMFLSSSKHDRWISSLQLIRRWWNLGHPFLHLKHCFSRHSLNLEIYLKRMILSDNTVLISRNFLNTVAITFVPPPLQFPEASHVTLLLLMLLLNPDNVSTTVHDKMIT